MIVDARVKARMEAKGLSQAELARRVGIAQPTVHSLIHTNKVGSKFLHRIARELETTPAYLEGEIDDPDKDAPPPRPIATIQHVMMAVALPCEDDLAEMFEGLLEAIGRQLELGELARELAQLLPTGLSQLRALPVDRQRRPPAEAASPEAPANADLEPTR